jgi:hypothetical protein
MITNDLFQPEREKAAGFLKDAMHLPSLKLEMKVEKQGDNASRKAFTSKEKLEKMIEKNPAVEQLKNKLNLKLDN